MTISLPPIPPDALLVLSGGSAESRWHFTQGRFAPTEVLSLARAGAEIFDVANPTFPRNLAVEWLMTALLVRLVAGSRTVVDTTGMTSTETEALRETAAHCSRPAFSLVVLEPARRGAAVSPAVAKAAEARVAGALAEGWTGSAAVTVGQRLDWAVCAPYPTASGWDIIGDIHGCARELWALLDRLGYRVGRSDDGTVLSADHPAGRRLAFAGDLVSRGPDSVGVLRGVRALVESGGHVLVPGNHELPLGSTLTTPGAGEYGDAEYAVLAACPPAEQRALGEFLLGLAPYRVLRNTQDASELVLAHAGLEPWFVGRADGWLRMRCTHGRPSWESQIYGADDPERLFPWQAAYTDPDRLWCAHGHWPTIDLGRGRRAPEGAAIPIWRGTCVNLDTNCVRGGALSALRWPEGDVVSVDAL